MKIINHVIKMKTAATLDFIDITDKIQQKVKQAGLHSTHKCNIGMKKKLQSV